MLILWVIAVAGSILGYVACGVAFSAFFIGLGGRGDGDSTVDYAVAALCWPFLAVFVTLTLLFYYPGVLAQRLAACFRKDRD